MNNRFYVKNGMRESGDISLEHYLDILKTAKQYVFEDLRALDSERLKEKGEFSFLGLQLRNRDDEDVAYVAYGLGYEHFSRFDPFVLTHMRDEAENIAGDFDLPAEEMTKRFYWEVEKFSLFGDKLFNVYTAFFSLLGEIVGVRSSSHLLEFRLTKDDWDKMTEGQRYLVANGEQLWNTSNVVLPYRTGDILRVDANPFGKPFYAVYCSETGPDLEHFEWTLTDYGYHRRDHYCLYLSEDLRGLALTELGTGMFTDYIPFPYSPIDQLSVVNYCENAELMKGSRLLKQDSAIFYHWLDESNNGHRKIDLD